MPKKKITAKDSLKAKTEINTNTPIINGHHCLDYLGGYSDVGYGWVRDSGQLKLAHRASYEIHHGPIPKDMLVLHACDRRSCVEPRHLRVGTQKDNAADRKARPKAPLSPSDKTAIINDTDDFNAIGRKYNISRNTVKQIKGLIP